MTTLLRIGRWPALLLALALTAPVLAIDPQDFADAEEEARYWTLIEEIRCLVCQNQNLADSPAGLAKDLRDQVLELMRSGRSDAEIKTYLTDRYGDYVLYNPPMKPATWGLWFGPLVLVAIGAAGMVLHLRRRQRHPAELAADPDQEALDRELDAVEAEREGH
ncbi:MAG: cytochrome c-type biogenesis protein [Pseudomonadota bacterium]